MEMVTQLGGVLTSAPQSPYKPTTAQSTHFVGTVLRGGPGAPMAQDSWQCDLELAPQGKAGSCGWPAQMLGKSWPQPPAATAPSEVESGRIDLKRTKPPLGQSVLIAPHCLKKGEIQG